MRPTEALVRPSALTANVRRLRAIAPDAGYCAVVKADGYGHGAELAAAAARAGGADWLAVATAEEAVELARGPGDGVPVLVLGEIGVQEARSVAQDRPVGLRLTVGSVAAAKILEEELSGPPVPVHLKVDTGMHRLGVDPTEVVEVARLLDSAAQTTLEGVWTHLAVADDPGDPFTDEQLERFRRALTGLAAAGVQPRVVHAANSAGLIAHPASVNDLVRVGIAQYGVDPGEALVGRVELEPVLSLVSRVRALRTVAPGEGVSYGRRWRAESETRVATVPIGYADGVRRSSPDAGVEVLIRGLRRPMLGVVTMDQLMVAVDDDVALDDEVVLIGEQGGDRVTANEIAGRLGTIGYEVLTSIGPRVPRRVIG